MVNFNKIIFFSSLLVFCSQCDSVHELQTGSILWKINNPPTETLHIEGPTNSFPTLNTIVLTRKYSLKYQKLLLMSNTSLPDSNILAQLYRIPLDSLSEQNYIYDQSENGFYALSVIEFLEGQKSVVASVQKPITRKHTYIFAIPGSELQNVEIHTVLKFHRLGNDEVPLVGIVSLE